MKRSLACGAMVVGLTIACSPEEPGLNEPGRDDGVVSPGLLPGGANGAALPSRGGTKPGVLASGEGSSGGTGGGAPGNEGPAAQPGGTPTTTIVRAKKIEAPHVVADVVFAKEIKARVANVEVRNVSLAERRWEPEVQDKPDIKGGEVRASVVYADAIDCVHLTAREINVQVIEVKDR